MTSFITLLRRELWEHTSLKVIPLILLAFVLLANIAFIFFISSSSGTISIIKGDETTQAVNALEYFTGMDSSRQTVIINGTMITTGMIINSIMLIAMFFYLLDCLYGERKDRTILFWKSLPVTNRATVLSKLSIAVLIVPAIIFVTIGLSNILTLAIQSYSLFHHQQTASLLWQQVDIIGLSMFSIFLLIQQTIWYFPVMGWLLFCSAWCRKSPIVVAVLIPAILVFIDSSFMLGTGIAEMLIERLPLGIMSMQPGVESNLIAYPYNLSAQQLPGFDMAAGISLPSVDDFMQFLMDSKVWLGIIIGIFFTGMAISLRRWRDDNL